MNFQRQFLFFVWTLISFSLYAGDSSERREGKSVYYFPNAPMNSDSAQASNNEQESETDEPQVGSENKDESFTVAQHVQHALSNNAAQPDAKPSQVNPKESFEGMKGFFGNVGIGAPTGSIGFFRMDLDQLMFVKITREYNQEIGDVSNFDTPHSIRLLGNLYPQCSPCGVFAINDSPPISIFKLKEPLYEVKTDWQKVAIAAAAAVGTTLFFTYVFGNGEKK
jgi:hypothetical protein